VSGGVNNVANGVSATVGGGQTNTSSAYASTVSGGLQNSASGSRAAIGGGQGNLACNTWSTVAGGLGNSASGYISFIGSGDCNTSSGARSAVGGGRTNTASGAYSFVGGGISSIASGGNSAVLGGRDVTISGNCSGGGGLCFTGGCANTFYWNNFCAISCMWATSYFESSDETLKNIHCRVNSFDNINPIYFKWKEGDSSRINIGYSAQNVQEILPDSVRTDEKGKLNVDYHQVHIYKMMTLEERIAKLEDKLKKYEA
jgi:hypothetical protein